MNQEEIRQVTARDKKWVSTKERVKISTTNAFTISAEVPEIFMLQFWYTINKILDICPRVQGVDFTEVPNDETTLTFLIDLGYKVPLYKHPSMYVDHMHQPWRTLAAVINKCLSGKAASNDMLRKSRIDILLGILKFVRIGEDFQEYGLPIPKTMLAEGIEQSESYQMFIKYSTDLLPPKKSSGKGSQDDNIIPEPDVALELGKSMSLTKDAKEEAARQVNATHERIMTKSPEPAKKRPSEQLAADTMEALKASRKSSRITPTTSREGTGTELGVLDKEKVTSKAKSNVILDWGSEQESEYSKEGDDDENIKWVDTDEEEEKNDDDDDKSINLEKTGDEETNDEFVHNEENAQDDDELVHVDEQVNDDEDEEMTNAKDADTGNSDEEITDTAKVDVEKTEVVKNDIKKAELPPTSSSLSVSSGFGNQFLNLSSDTSLIGIVKDTSDAEINSLLDPSVLTPIPETPLVVLAITLLPPLTVSSILHKDVQELKEVDNTTTLRALLRSEIPSVVNAYLRSSLGDALQKVLQKNMKELIRKYPQQVDYKEMIEESMQANIINEVKNQLPKFLPKAVFDFATSVIQSTVKNALEKTPLLLAQSSYQAQYSLKAAESLSEYELKMILFDKMDKSRSYLTYDKY
ncbi:hypothetical protein Tco_0918807 [Tanacetum coccineum]